MQDGWQPTLRTLATVAILGCLVAACASQPETYESADRPGFLLGLWHGATIFFALVGHLFDNGIRIYAFPNNGGWYDFGFFVGVGSWGGLFGARA